MKREVFIDHLRMLLCCLVIIHHTAIAYGAMGGWCYVVADQVRGGTQVGLSTLLAVNQAFFMSLFFFISAFFTPAAFDRKGARAYLKDRLIRLGLPLLVYSLLIHPTLLYAIQCHTNSTTDNWARYVWNSITKRPNTAHMWFAVALLLFESAYTIYRILPLGRLARWMPHRLPTHRQVGAFILTCNLLAFGLRQFYPIGENFMGLQFGFFGLYLGMYAAGILAGRNQWLDQLTLRAAGLWFGLAWLVLPFVVNALITVQSEPGLMNRYIGGMHWQAYALTSWEAITCVGVSGFLWVMFRRYLNNYTPLTAHFAADTYGVYVVHPLIVVGATMLFEKLTMQPLAKFGCVSVISIVTCFLLAHLLRMLPVVRRVL